MTHFGTHPGTLVPLRDVRGALVLMLASATLVATPCARAGPFYWVTLQGAADSSATPLRRSYQTATPGVSPTLVHEEGLAYPGQVGTHVRLDTTWPFEIQAGVTGVGSARAATDDFVITGPPGATQVAAGMHFRSRMKVDRGGGLPGSDLHRAAASLHVAAAQLVADGSCWSSNHDQSSDGVLAASSPPLVGADFTLSGSFPVSVPFSVSLEFRATDRTYGDSTDSPGFTETDGIAAGVVLGDENGRVMDLPPGYTVDAPSWGVDQNHFVATASVRVASTGGAALTAAPNPSHAAVTFECFMPRPGTVRLEIVDPQGRSVRRVFSGAMDAGRQVLEWDGRGESGEPVAPGVYLAVMRFAGRTVTRRVALVH